MQAAPFVPRSVVPGVPVVSRGLRGAPRGRDVPLRHQTHSVLLLSQVLLRWPTLHRFHLPSFVTFYTVFSHGCQSFEGVGCVYHARKARVDDSRVVITGKIFGNKEMRLLMLGLDAAGKTSESAAETDFLNYDSLRLLQQFYTSSS